MSNPPYEVVVLGPEESAEQNLRGLLQLLLQSSAKQFNCALDILSETYGHKKEEMCELIRDSPKMAAVLKEGFSIVPSAPAPKPEAKTKKGKKVVIRRKSTQGEPQPSSGSAS